MDLALLVYGISIIGKLSVVAAAAITIAIVVGILAAIVRVFHIRETWDSERDNQIKEGRRNASTTVLKYSSAVVIVAMLIDVVLPSEKTAYTMVAAYAAQKVAENDKVQQMSGKVLTIIEQKLDGYIEDGIAEAEKKVSDATKQSKKKHNE